MIETEGGLAFVTAWGPEVSELPLSGLWSQVGASLWFSVTHTKKADMCQQHSIKLPTITCNGSVWLGLDIQNIKAFFWFPII